MRRFPFGLIVVSCQGRDNSYAMHVYSPEEWPEGALDWELVASSNLRCDHLEPRYANPRFLSFDAR